MTHMKELFISVSDSGNHNIPSSTDKNKKKKLFYILLASFLIVGAIIGIVAGVASRKNNSDAVAHHPVLKSSCSVTRYPELCYSAIANAPGATDNLETSKDVIEKSLNLTIFAVQHNYFTIKKLMKRKGLTKREKCALHDCLEMVDETLDELRETEKDIEEYPKKGSLSKAAEDLKILLSAAMTNQDTCIDGFSHEEADKNIRKALLAGQVHVQQMCSNALAMIKNLTDTDMATERRLNGERKLMETDEINITTSYGIIFPSWLSVGDRKLLQSSSVTPNVIVAADGSGNYKTVSAAVAAAPAKSSTRYIIRIKAGIYRENVDIPKTKTNIMFLGDGRSSTIITGSRNVVDGSTTFNSATVGTSLIYY
ncbi:hypothetical protein GIB67_041902 [Kingdonia uniflora]|uniref:Pectinesterase n=1 Tax=Kingdonia uniflora TaxID=39325 RepID=A0A7J7N4S2_9MAGN|nr:hypothetical protein GIB67_041902 [Kingdonia uniflora]